jgi:energy-converting hydrogenase Eha subunit F
MEDGDEDGRRRQAAAPGPLRPFSTYCLLLALVLVHALRVTARVWRAAPQPQRAARRKTRNKAPAAHGWV